MQTAYLGLGSNLGDRLATLRDAVALLAQEPHNRRLRVSGVYETTAVGLIDQPDFLNLALALETTLAPHALLDLALGIEQKLGRVRRERWGPRTVDLDLLAFDHLTLADDRLTLPHPRLTERAFVLVPLAEIAPDLVVFGAPVRQHLDRLDRAGVRSRPDLHLDLPAPRA